MTGARRDTAERTAAHRSRSIRDRRREALCLRGQGHVLEPDRRLPAGSPDARQGSGDAVKRFLPKLSGIRSMSGASSEASTSSSLVSLG